jgi:general secretion pathway protein D
VEKILDQLDRPQGTDTTLNLNLSYAEAVTVSNNLNILFARPGSPPKRGGNQQPQRNPNRARGSNDGAAMSFELEDEIVEDAYFPWLGGGGDGGGGRGGGSRPGGGSGGLFRPVSDLVGKVRVVPDMRTNSLMVTTSSHFFPQVLKVINDLDVPTPQVLIEATIIEVSGDFRDRFGVRWSPDGNQVFDLEDLDSSLLARGGVDYSEIFTGGVLEQAMKRGVLDANVNLDLLIQFLRKTTKSRVRSAPRINVADNEKGKLFVGARIPFITGSLNTVEGGRNDAFQYRDVGIILEVTPNINESGEVALRIRVESSQIRKGETLFGGAILDTRNYRTDITVMSGQTLVLGGIIQTEESEVERKIPLLGDIPVIGWLFKKVDTVREEVELMVFLKPTVTRTPEEVQRLMEEEKRQTPQIRAFENALKETAGVKDAEADSKPAPKRYRSKVEGVAQANR